MFSKPDNILPDKNFPVLAIPSKIIGFARVSLRIFKDVMSTPIQKIFNQEVIYF